MTWKRKLFDASLFFHKLIADKFGNAVYTTLKSDKFYKPLHDYEPRAAALELISREIYRYSTAGAAAELGVYRGDFARKINHFFPDKKLYLFDTFEGFDGRDADVDRKKNFSAGSQDFSQTSIQLVLGKMEHRENCIVKKGWFPDTADGIDESFCFASLDVDLYQPTLAGLRFFYPRLSPGGYLMIHDFNNGEYPGVRQAVKEFCTENHAGYVCLPDFCGSAVIAR